MTDIITSRIDDFSRLSGIGRSKVYEMIAAGEIESVYIGGRRLIVVDSWRRLVEAAPRDLGRRPAMPLARPSPARPTKNPDPRA
jgi:excisionase family DNA binding protein